jgi:hypothetical protein
MKNIQKELGMGTHAKAFDAKKWALTKCIEWAIKFTDEHPQKQINTLNIYMDNTTVVKTTYDISLSSRTVFIWDHLQKFYNSQWIGKIIRKGIDEWLESKEGHKIRVAWIPAHTGIRGNKEWTN